MRAAINELLTNGDFVGGGGSVDRAASSEYMTVSYSRVCSAPTATFAAGFPQLQFQVGDVLDVTFRIKGFQFESGDIQTPLQFNYGLNDITEAGVADLWHIYNDGGDSLNCVLPAGTYGVANLAIDRSYRIESLVSDGSTPITTLIGERQIDAIYRFGAFSPAEQLAIQQYWEKEYPL